MAPDRDDEPVEALASNQRTNAKLDAVGGARVGAAALHGIHTASAHERLVRVERPRGATREALGIHADAAA